jgi:urease accessory protein
MRFLNDKRVAFLMYLAAVGLMLIFPSWALAHDSVSHFEASAAAGFTHPFSGLDHLFLMFALGYLLNKYTKAHRWGMFAAFLISMLVGAVLAITSVWTTPVENAILLSVLVAAGLHGFRNNLSLQIVYTLMMVTGLVHGIAHGLELPQESMALSYVLGFLIASSIILLAGFFLSSKVSTMHARAWCGRVISLVLLSCFAFAV